MRTADRQVGIAHAECARVVLEPRRLSEPHGLPVDVEAQPIQIGRDAKLVWPIPWSGHFEAHGP